MATFSNITKTYSMLKTFFQLVLVFFFLHRNRLDHTFYIWLTTKLKHILVIVGFRVTHKIQICLVLKTFCSVPKENLGPRVFWRNFPNVNCIHLESANLSQNPGIYPPSPTLGGEIVWEPSGLFKHMQMYAKVVNIQQKR